MLGALALARSQLCDLNQHMLNVFDEATLEIRCCSNHRNPSPFYDSVAIILARSGFSFAS
jgi:hypothetical protein